MLVNIAVHVDNDVIHVIKLAFSHHFCALYKAMNNWTAGRPGTCGNDTTS